MNNAAPASLILALVATTWPSPALAVDHEVGPGLTYESIGDVPLESLTAGDRVLIHHRAAPYAEKFVICAQGTESEPIVIRGVPGAGGELPVLDGRDATTRGALDYWNEERSLVKIGGASTPDCSAPSWIVVENLEIRSARPPFTFTTDGGGASSYDDNAASVFIETGEHIVLRNLVIHDSGNGLFASHAACDVTVEFCHIFDNGNEGSIYEHNNYTEANGIVFQYNHLGPLRSGCDGNNLKDRSASTVVRYNWIEGGNRQLDLVDSSHLSSEDGYFTTFVYGNVLVEHEGEGNSQIIHYGGDSGDTSLYRKGTLHLYNNTIVSTRTGNTTLVRLSSAGETADVRNNIILVTAEGSRLAMSNADGTVDLRNNWMKTGWQDSHSTLTGEVNDLGGNITGDAPGFEDLDAQDYHLLATSDCIHASTDLASAALPDHILLQQYVRHRGTEPRPVDGVLDMGAFETCTTGDCTGAGDEVVDAPPDLPPDSSTDVVTDATIDPVMDTIADVPADTIADASTDAATDTADEEDDTSGGSGGCACAIGRRPGPVAGVLVLLLMGGVLLVSSRSRRANWRA